jgi:hypothetical protein
MAQSFREFQDEHGRWPSITSGPALERRLGSWIAIQRFNARKISDALSFDRVSILNETVPGWDRSADDAWQGRADEVRRFYVAQGRWPAGLAADINERRLGGWMNKQRQDIKSGVSRLSTSRIAYLTAIAPGWTHNSSSAWTANAEALSHFRDNNNSWPSARSSDLAEERLGLWLESQRASARRSNVGSDRISVLDAAAPGWLIALD